MNNNNNDIPVSDRLKMLEIILSWSISNGFTSLTKKTRRSIELIRQNARVGDRA